MTDNEIIKALESCIKNTCSECPFYKNWITHRCGELRNLALDLLNRQKAEIEKQRYILMGVMHSVDKWLEGDELKQDEVNRAAIMREKTLKIVENQQAEIEKLEEMIELGDYSSYSAHLAIKDRQRKNAEYTNELKAEIERLQKNCQQMDAEVSKLERRELAKNIVLSIKYIPLTNERICAVGWDSALVEKIKTEAIKEFWNRLKKEKVTHKNFGEMVLVEDGDNLAKEMTE